MSHVLSYNKSSIIVSNTLNYTIPDDESKILAWLSPLEPWVRHRDIGAQRVDNVGDWLLGTKEFRCWHNGNREGKSDHGTLFCDGNPGVGKSYIISLVIDKLCDDAVKEDTVVTCFYFDFAARNEQSPVNMLGSLLRQLVGGLAGIPETVVQSFRDQQKVIGGRRLQVPGILDMFQAITATKRTFICVDALDKCVPEHRMVVLESLGQILRESPNTRIFMTGRPHVRSEVERKLHGTATFALIKPTEHGFIRYLREKLRNDTFPDAMSATLEADILRSIPEISSETFLLASLHIEAILQETTLARRRKRLKSLKDGTGLGDAYGATMERIWAQGGERLKLAIATLTWICHAERPLLVDELCHALAVEIGATDFDPENTPSIGTLLGCCQGLIAVDKEATTVRLIHITVQEYLCAQPGLFCRPHSTIAQACLTYLNSQQIKNLSPDHLVHHQNISFLKYSSRYWGTHASKDLSEQVTKLALELLNNYKDHISAISLLKQALHPNYIELIGTSPLFSGLHCASFFGIVELVTTLMNEKGYDINQRDCTGRTPLSWAAANGHEGMVKILLEKGDVDSDRPDKHDRTPLGWAALGGHERVVKLLLELENVDPNCSDMYGQTPLWCASAEGHEGVVKLLLGREDVDPNRSDKKNRTPLGFAAAQGHERVVKLILGREDTDPNKPDSQNGTPLSLAALRGYGGVVKRLLDREDVDPNRLANGDQTPLGIAAFWGHEEVVKLLLGREDIDPDRPNNHDITPLSLTAYSGYGGVAKLLLDREDIDPNYPDCFDRTPLFTAAFWGREEVVKLLLEREDVDPGRPDKQDCTPLSLAAYKGHDEVTKLLLDREDIDPNHPANGDQTPLGIAAFWGHEGVVKVLLGRKDVDPNRQDVNDQTPLGWAACEGHEGVVELLLGREDIAPNRGGNGGRTPLCCAAFGGHEGVMKLLLGREDVDPNRPDSHNATPLSLAAFKGYGGVANLLLDREDVDPNCPDDCDRTPLCAAAFRGHEEVVKLLLGREGVDPDRPDKQDHTPLSLAACNGHAVVTKLLLDREDIDPNHPDKDDRTPIGLAALEGHGRVVKLLLEREGIDPDRPDKHGHTPLSHASIQGHEEVMKLLESRRSIKTGDT